MLDGLFINWSESKEDNRFSSVRSDQTHICWAEANGHLPGVEMFVDLLRVDSAVLRIVGVFLVNIIDPVLQHPRAPLFIHVLNLAAIPMLAFFSDGAILSLLLRVPASEPPVREMELFP